ncbi:MAG: hypothetical protein PHS62_02690 [Patescibacteria group bacterium]|nr:hypothetical protein [Patescibacteria group bacterium]
MKKIFLLKSFLVFIVFFSLFFAAHFFISGFVSADDPYYHAKHAFLMEQSGRLDLVEPWLEFHFFNYAPVDPWWGFHLGLALFIHCFGLSSGVKIFASLLAALVFSVFYLVLNGLRAKHPLVWTFLLFFSSTTFSYRLFLERPHLLSMIVLPLAFLFLVKGKNFWLFILSLSYVLCYQLAPLIILLALAYFIVDIYANKRINLKPLIAAAGGILVGTILHPAGMNYFYVMFITFGRILFLKLTGVDLNIGSEVQLTSFSDFLNCNFLVLLLYIFSMGLFLSLKKFKKNSVVSDFLFLCSSFWLLITLLFPRGVEYWLPATFIFSAVIFSDFSAEEEFAQIKNWLADKINFRIAGFFIFSALFLIIFYNLSNVFCSLYYSKTSEQGENFRQANNWLKANTKKDSVVFYDNWGMWPMMFFYNDYNHYVIGMDPTFTYEYDARTYWLWRNISSQGLYCDQPDLCLNISPAEQIKSVPLAIKTVFRSKFVVASNYQGSNLIKTLNNLKDQASLVFENKDLLVYEIK